MSELTFEAKKEILNQKTTKELMGMAKELDLPRYNGKNKKTKTELIDILLSSGCLQFEESYDVSEKSEFEEMLENTVNEKKVKEDKPWEFKSREKEVESAEVGTLIAFLDTKGKARTGALVNRSSNKKMVKLVTEFDREFIIPYANVLWVKNGTRWPKGIYKMLKGIV